MNNEVLNEATKVLLIHSFLFSLNTATMSNKINMTEKKTTTTMN